MHVLTKVFVVIATLLSILLAGMVIVHAGNTDKVRADYESEVSRRLSAEQSLQVASAQGGSEKGRLLDQVQQLSNQTVSLQSQLTDLQSERAKLLADLNRALSEKTTSESKIGELTETTRTQASLVQSMREELTRIRGSEVALRTRSLEMEDTISDLTGKNDVLTQNYRALQEEIVELRRSAQAGINSGGGAASSGAAAGVLGQPYTYSGPRIVGRVESVQREGTSGKTLAKISVGSNDRVANNMLLRVVRDNNFIANIVVRNTDLAFSVGEVDFLGRANDIREGDMIVSRFE